MPINFFLLTSTSDGENFQEQVVGGKMNSDNFGHKIKVAYLDSLNNIFCGFYLNLGVNR